MQSKVPLGDKMNPIKEDELLIGQALSRHILKSKQVSICPTLEDLSLLIEEKLSGQKRDEVMGHLAKCKDCYETYLLSLQLSRPAKKKHLHFLPYGLAAGLLISVLSGYIIMTMMPFKKEVQIALSQSEPRIIEPEVQLKADIQKRKSDIDKIEKRHAKERSQLQEKKESQLKAMAIKKIEEKPYYAEFELNKDLMALLELIDNKTTTDPKLIAQLTMLMNKKGVEISSEQVREVKIERQAVSPSPSINPVSDEQVIKTEKYSAFESYEYDANNPERRKPIKEPANKSMKKAFSPEGKKAFVELKYKVLVIRIPD